MSQMPANIDRFNLTALRLFSQLYDAFPSESTVDTAELGVEAASEGMAGPEMLTFAEGAEDVVTWLAEEGFIRVAGTHIGTEYSRVRLTLKALTVLGYIPISIKSNKVSEPLIDKIKRTLASGAEKAGAEAAKSLLSGVFRLAMAHASSGGTSGITNV